MRGKVVITVLLAWCSITLFARAQQIYEKGKIVHNIICKNDSRQSYDLYLPSDYSQEKKWPILFAFDPFARGNVPVELFKSAAENYHYIVMGSNNSQNGPWEVAFTAMKAMWQDANERFSIDRDRIYVTGFSGGSRSAALFAEITGAPVAGIIACGAGLPENFKAKQINPAMYYGIVGIEDFNYKEFVSLRRELKGSAVKHFIEIIDGNHKWPIEEACTRALDWMETQAMKKGVLKKEKNVMDSIYQKMLEKGQLLIKSGELYYAVDYYLSIKKLFEGLRDVSVVQIKLSQLANLKGYNKFVVEEDKRNERELAFIERFKWVFYNIKKPNQPKQHLRKILSDLQINVLKKLAERGKNIYNSAMAKRLLAELWIKSSKEGLLYLEKDDLKRSTLFFKIASEADKQNPYSFYNLALIYSLTKNKKEAMKSLKRALEKGVHFLSVN